MQGGIFIGPWGEPRFITWHERYNCLMPVISFGPTSSSFFPINKKGNKYHTWKLVCEFMMVVHDSHHRISTILPTERWRGRTFLMYSSTGQGSALQGSHGQCVIQLSMCVWGSRRLLIFLYLPRNSGWIQTPVTFNTSAVLLFQYCPCKIY